MPPRRLLVLLVSALIFAACGATPTTPATKSLTVSLGHAALGTPSATCSSDNGVWQDWSPKADEGFDPQDTEVFGPDHGAALGVLQQLAKDTLDNDTRFGNDQVDFEQVVVTSKPIEGCSEFIYSADSEQWVDGVIRVKFSLVGVASGSGPSMVDDDKKSASWIEVREPLKVVLQP